MNSFEIIGNILLNFFNHLIENMFSIKGLHFWRLKGGLLIVKMSLVFNQNTLAAFFLFRYCHSIPGVVEGWPVAVSHPECLKRWVLWGLDAECSCPEEQSSARLPAGRWKYESQEGVMEDTHLAMYHPLSCRKQVAM